jgi:hypothetical protein
MKTILEIAQTVASELEIKANVASVVGNSDVIVQQIRRYAERELQWLVRNYEFTELIKEHTFEYEAGQDSYALPKDFDRFVYSTMWDRSQGFVLYPVNTQEWQTIQSSVTASAVNGKFKVQGISSRQFKVTPTPASSDSGRVIAFNYISRNIIKPQAWETGLVVSAGQYKSHEDNYYKAATSGTTGATAPVHTTGSESDDLVTWNYFDGEYKQFLADTDEPVIDDYLVELGAMARYARMKKLQNADDIYLEYRKEVEKISGNKKAARVITMGRGGRMRRFLGTGNLPQTGYTTNE